MLYHQVQHGKCGNRKCLDHAACFVVSSVYILYDIIRNGSDVGSRQHAPTCHVSSVDYVGLDDCFVCWSAEVCSVF